MESYIVTIKLPKNPNHNPRNKMTGPCPVNQHDCTDVTGEHHSFLERDAVNGIAGIRNKYSGWHITRIERI